MCVWGGENTEGWKRGRQNGLDLFHLLPLNASVMMIRNRIKPSKTNILNVNLHPCKVVTLSLVKLFLVYFDCKLSYVDSFTVTTHCCIFCTLIAYVKHDSHLIDQFVKWH